MPVETNSIVAPAARPLAHHRRATRLAIQAKRKIDIPAIRFHSLLDRTARIWRRLNSHRGLNVASLESEHVLALTGINRRHRKGDYSATSRRAGGVSQAAATVWSGGFGLHWSDDILPRAITDLKSPLQITLGDIDNVPTVTQLHFRALTRPFEHRGCLHGLAGSGRSIFDLQVVGYGRWRSRTITGALGHKCGS